MRRYPVCPRVVSLAHSRDSKDMSIRSRGSNLGAVEQPATSPDLDSIVTMWALLKSVSERELRTLAELQTVVKGSWKALIRLIAHCFQGIFDTLQPSERPAVEQFSSNLMLLSHSKPSYLPLPSSPKGGGKPQIVMVYYFCT